MAVDHGGIDVPMTTTAAVTQYYFVKGSGSTGKTVAVTALATDVVLGIAQEAATASGDTIAVRITGTSKLKLGGTVNCGEGVISHTNGTGITAAYASDEKPGAIALEYGVAGDIIEVVLRPVTQCN
jgi:hypothetical protein